MAVTELGTFNPVWLFWGLLRTERTVERPRLGGFIGQYRILGLAVMLTTTLTDSTAVPVCYVLRWDLRSGAHPGT